MAEETRGHTGSFLAQSEVEVVADKILSLCLNCIVTGTDRTDICPWSSEAREPLCRGSRATWGWKEAGS